MNFLWSVIVRSCHLFRFSPKKHLKIHDRWVWKPRRVQNLCIFLTDILCYSCPVFYCQKGSPIRDVSSAWQNCWKGPALVHLQYELVLLIPTLGSAQSCRHKVVWCRNLWVTATRQWWSSWVYWTCLCTYYAGSEIVCAEIPVLWPSSPAKCGMMLSADCQCAYISARWQQQFGDCGGKNCDNKVLHLIWWI